MRGQCDERHEGVVQRGQEGEESVAMCRVERDVGRGVRVPLGTIVVVVVVVMIVMIVVVVVVVVHGGASGGCGRTYLHVGVHNVSSARRCGVVAGGTSLRDESLLASVARRVTRVTGRVRLLRIPILLRHAGLHGDASHHPMLQGHAGLHHRRGLDVVVVAA
jgi:hypothetical protein